MELPPPKVMMPISNIIDPCTKILIVEDNMNCAYSLTSMLQQYSLESDLAINGPQAVRIVKERYEKYRSTH